MLTDVSDCCVAEPIDGVQALPVFTGAPSPDQLRAALAAREFFLLYQPKVSCSTGQIVGVEALLRWQRGEVTLPPDSFIPVLEESGLILDVGAWVLREACRQAQEWHKAGIAGLAVAVNLSGRQLQDPGVYDMVKQVLADTGLPARLLELELTESFLIADPDQAIATLTRLKGLGLKVAVDDFGTGYSSLAYLRRLPIDTLKVDRTFVRDISANAHDASITRAIINLAHNLNLNVVAEGVETDAQLGMLIANHCDVMQGFHFSKPVDAAKIESLQREGTGMPGRVIAARQGERTLLLVDDEENILGALKRLLRRANFRVLTATSATEGLKLLAENHVDVVLSDQRMPVMTGVEFLRRVKDIHPDSVRMVLSGYTDLQSVTDAINEGAIYKFLTKPWDDEHLLANIEESFRRKEMGDENRRLGRELSASNARLSVVNKELRSLLRDNARQSSRDEAVLRIMQEALQHVPVALLGIDTDGLIALANQAADALLPQCAPLIGREADEVLPAVLLTWLGAGAAGELACTIGTTPCTVTARAMGAASTARGHLLAIRSGDAS